MSNLYLFDCFGVVVSDVSRLWMQGRLTQEQQEYVRKEVYRKVDCGTMSFESSFDVLAELSGQSKQLVLQQWESCMYPIEGMPQLLDQLRSQGHTVALLSNAAASYVDQLFNRYDLHRHFDKLFVSSDFGCAKPDKQFYQLCLQSFSQHFDKIFFTDDNPKNLEGLQSLGICPLLFCDVPTLRRQLLG